MQPDPNRKKRTIIFYATALLFFTALGVYLTWALRTLLLPIIVGALLAYICRPLLASTRVSWMPNSLRVMLLLGTIVFGFTYLGKVIRENIPKKEDQIVLQVRLNYKLHEKFNSVMGITSETPDGNFIYNLAKDDLLPVMKTLYTTLDLTNEEAHTFETYYQQRAQSTDPIPEKFMGYFKENRKRLAKEKKTLKSALKKSPDRDVAAIAESPSKKEKSSVLITLLDALSTWLLTPFVFIFLLFDNGQIMKFFIRLVPNKFFELSLTIVEEVDQAIGNYLRGTLLECSLVGLTLASGLYVVGLDLNIAFLIGSIAGLANAIPFLGPVIGLVVGLSYGIIVEDISPLLPFVTSENLFVGIFLCVAVAQVLDNVLFQPVVLGGAVNLHPLVVIIGVMGGSVIFGFAGMLLAIPAIVVFKVIIETLFLEMKAYRII